MIILNLRLTLAILASIPLSVFGQLQDQQALLTTSPLPFIVVEGNGESSKHHGQGVVISEEGLVLSAGHLAWMEAEKAFTENFKALFRGSPGKFPEGVQHTHSAKFIDREDTIFKEYHYDAKLIKQGQSRFVNGAELALFKIASPGPFKPIHFFSDKKPTLEIGETLTLCHFVHPDQPADPTFLMSPLKVVGIGQTSAGIQYLAEGYYRDGSSGSAILKDGKLIGIQSAGYEIRAQNGTEHPIGLVSFELVWGDLIKTAPASELDK